MRIFSLYQNSRSRYCDPHTVGKKMFTKFIFSDHSIQTCTWWTNNLDTDRDGRVGGYIDEWMKDMKKITWCNW